MTINNSDKQVVRTTFFVVLVGFFCPAGYSSLPDSSLLDSCCVGAPVVLRAQGKRVKTTDGVECCVQACARLEPHVTFLATQKLHVSPLLLPGFSDARIAVCIEKIERDGTGAPLRALWQACSSICTDNESFVREFSLLIFVLYDALIRSATLLAPKPTRAQNQGLAGGFVPAFRMTIPWLSMISLMMKLNKIPIDKLFDVLDECLRYYTEIVTEYTTWNTRNSLFYYSTNPRHSMARINNVFVTVKHRVSPFLRNAKPLKKLSPLGSII